jgi:hypothetical protein
VQLLASATGALTPRGVCAENVWPLPAEPCCMLPGARAFQRPVRQSSIVFLECVAAACEFPGNVLGHLQFRSQQVVFDAVFPVGDVLALYCQTRMVAFALTVL